MENTSNVINGKNYIRCEGFWDTLDTKRIRFQNKRSSGPREGKSEKAKCRLWIDEEHKQLYASSWSTFKCLFTHGNFTAFHPSLWHLGMETQVTVYIHYKSADSVCLSYIKNGPNSWTHALLRVLLCLWIWIFSPCLKCLSGAYNEFPSESRAFDAETKAWKMHSKLSFKGMLLLWQSHCATKECREKQAYKIHKHSQLLKGNTQIS